MVLSQPNRENEFIVGGLLVDLARTCKEWRHGGGLQIGRKLQLFTGFYSDIFVDVGLGCGVKQMLIPSQTTCVEATHVTPLLLSGTSPKHQLQQSQGGRDNTFFFLLITSNIFSAFKCRQRQSHNRAAEGVMTNHDW